MFSPGIEPGTFRVLGGCDNHYTTETELERRAALTARVWNKIATRKWNSPTPRKRRESFATYGLALKFWH